MKKALSVSLGVAMLIDGQDVNAADKPTASEGAYRLGEIVVSASPESIVENAGTIYRVSAEQIKQRNARTLDEALQLVPGITIRVGGDGTPRIDLRGFRTRHVQLFLNGIPIRNTYDGQFDPTLIPADIISEIKVTSGGGSVLYGPGGNGGAIDIITTSGAEGIHGKVGLEIREGNAHDGEASLFGSNGKFDFYLNANTQSRDKFLLSDDFTPTKDEDGDERENSDRERQNLFGKPTYHATDDTTMGLTFSHTTGEQEKNFNAVHRA